MYITALPATGGMPEVKYRTLNIVHPQEKVCTAENQSRIDADKADKAHRGSDISATNLPDFTDRDCRRIFGFAEPGQESAFIVASTALVKSTLLRRTARRYPRPTAPLLDRAAPSSNKVALSRTPRTRGRG